MRSIRIFAAISGLGLIPSLASSAKAQDAPPDGVYVIFDGSGSMWGQLADGSYKIHVAKAVLSEFAGRDFGGSELALRAYGHRREGDCSDTELVADFGPAGTVAERIRAFMQTVNPLGRTPITRSLRAALVDFGDRTGEIILISDGIETCDPDPCELISQWQQDRVDIRVHVVGFGLQEEDRASLQCISETSGGEYRDAQSANDLETGLADIYDRTVPSSVTVIGLDPDGARVRVEGTLLQDGQARFEVDSEGRHDVDPGTYALVAGVQTSNGELFEPVEVSDVVVRDVGETTVEVRVTLPPTVWARFTVGADDERGSGITAYQDGEEAFGFRWIDTVYAMPGTYEFRAAPNRDNELSVTQSVPPGERTEVLFDMVQTVRAVFAAMASGSGIVFRENFELWQDGEQKYQVHRVNGAQVIPGRYTLRMVSDLFIWERPDVVITTQEQQSFSFEVPMGHVTLRYFEANGTQAPDKRAFVSPAGENRRVYVSSGSPYPLPAGDYSVIGRPDPAVYGGPVPFAIRVGEDIVVDLRPR